MMAVGRERMARFGDRFRYQVGDFADGSLPSDIDGSFDIIVSAAAIHHLPPERKRSLYRSIYHHTAPGGCFFNLDSMGPSDEYLRERYRQARERERVRAGEEPATGGHGGGFPHYFEPVEDHLRWLREAGFMPVDCFWKELGRALVGGFRR
jgi:tRNA (cmo5U34)-methyltransferase